MREYTHTHTHRYFKEIRGITLVALVVTIVVLIILATISINIIFGEEGLVERARQAKQELANAQVEEKQILTETANSIDTYITGEREQITVDKEEYEQLLQDVEELQSKVLKYDEKYVWEGTTLSSGQTRKEYTIENDGIYYIEIYGHTMTTVARIQTNILCNAKPIVGNYDKVVEAHATSSSSTILNLKKGDVIVGYFYCNAAVESGYFSCRVIQLQ